MTLEEERLKIREQRFIVEEQRRTLEREKREFTRRIEMEDRRLEQQQKLFDMKMKILEEELLKLASEKEHVERQKAFYSRVQDFEENQQLGTGKVVKGELFFSGVGSKQSLKKRYKDLIKIYHPDNVDGDKNTIQEINREYNQLSKVFV